MNTVYTVLLKMAPKVSKTELRCTYLSLNEGTCFISQKTTQEEVISTIQSRFNSGVVAAERTWSHIHQLFKDPSYLIVQVKNREHCLKRVYN